MTERYLDRDAVKRLLGDAPSATIPQPGEVVAGKYRIKGTLGAGGIACVLEAEHQLLDTTVALKLLAPEAMAEADLAVLRERFLVEAKAAVKIDSPHVARVMDVGTLDNGAPFIVMERLEGCNLEELLELEPQLSVADAADYVLQTLQGLAHAHVLGVVHRDLKPANLFLVQRPDSGPIIKIVDFGIALVLDDAGRPSRSGRLTRSGATLGSPMYMSPEQVRGEGPVDHRTDIWSTGVVLYELLTGNVPFGPSAEGMGEVFAAILEEPFVPPSHQRPDLPPELDAVVGKALERDVELRYADVALFARAIAPFGSGKWAHLVDSIEEPLRRRLVRMSAPQAFSPVGPMAVIVPAPEPEPEPEPEPAAVESDAEVEASPSRRWPLLLVAAVLVTAAAWALIRLAHL